MKKNNNTISVKNASENNLKNISLSIPKNAFTVVTGVSGSGKSSLAYDVVYRESQRRFIESFQSYSRSYIQKIAKPKVENIEGLQAALVINQQAGNTNPRSTVGTLSGTYDLLRLLFARTGERRCFKCNQAINSKDKSCPQCNAKQPELLARLFSFNSPYGACSKCNGLGLVEKIDPNKLIANPELSLREGALVPTTPTGYIVYSQVRVDELNKVCQAHGFSVDIPWKELTPEQQHVIMYGSTKVKILFGNTLWNHV